MSRFLNKSKCSCSVCQPKRVTSCRTSHDDFCCCFKPVVVPCKCSCCQPKHKEVKPCIQKAKKGGKDMCHKCKDFDKKHDVKQKAPMCQYLRTLQAPQPVRAIVVGGTRFNNVNMFLNFNPQTGIATFMQPNGAIWAIGCDQLDAIITRDQAPGGAPAPDLGDESGDE